MQSFLRVRCAVQNIQCHDTSIQWWGGVLNISRNCAEPAVWQPLSHKLCWCLGKLGVVLSHLWRRDTNTQLLN
eukprot:COSAG01_NODE_61220_length_290_cov_1.560209_1_plen_72_part_10